MTTRETIRQIIDRARAAGHDALGIANDPEIIDALARLTRRREERQMKRLASILDGLINKYREFGFKLGKKDGVFVAEMNVPPFKPATAVGRDLLYVLTSALAQLRFSIDPHRVLIALDEQELDDAVTELEDAGSERPTPPPPLPCSTFTFDD
jgi:hypothetical protein